MRYGSPWRWKEEILPWGHRTFEFDTILLNYPLDFQKCNYPLSTTISNFFGIFQKWAVLLLVIGKIKFFPKVHGLLNIWKIQRSCEIVVQRWHLHFWKSGGQLKEMAMNSKVQKRSRMTNKEALSALKKFTRQLTFGMKLFFNYLNSRPP